MAKPRKSPLPVHKAVPVFRNSSVAPPPVERLNAQHKDMESLAREFPYNQAKPHEFVGQSPDSVIGQHVLAERDVLSSTLTESNPSDKTGSGVPRQGVNPNNASLDRVRADASDKMLTTNQGVSVADNQNTLKAGVNGPSLLQDFILREKITHFDHERIPERVVHARGSGAHGYFECYASLAHLTRASVFSAASKRTPVFVRFSTVAGERGSADTVRDVRGFAVKFYTDEGNWDLVGNNMPVFFIQDAMKFPDVIHAVKPEPHHGMPQAASAHDTFWDFVSLMPETTHMLLWLMSDRAIPRSYRMMQGFGVHTFRFVNQAGDAKFVKFHWSPLAGTHSLVWDEAVKISGADPDFHRRDLWEAIESGVYPEWELAVQVFSEADADRFSFDVLDATKLIPEELVDLTPIGKMVLNRNPDNFFAETEQVAFCAAHIVPGIDFSNDPLLAGRIHSYIDTQISRLGGANFHEIPINASLAPVHNNQRDGMHRQTIFRGRVAYEPNSLGGGCPYQDGMRGFAAFPQVVEGQTVRGKPERFAEHYQQATLFWNSQSDTERQHIINAFRFELSRVQTAAIRERVIAQLLNVNDLLALKVADGLGMQSLPAPLPMSGGAKPGEPEILHSGALSLMAHPGQKGMCARRIAILVMDGTDTASAHSLRNYLTTKGAAAHFVSSRIGALAGTQSEPLIVEFSLATAPSVLWDAVVILNSQDVSLVRSARVIEFIKDQFRHCKPMLLVGDAANLLQAAAIPDDPDHTLVLTNSLSEAVLERFVYAVSGHRNFIRESCLE